ncbi:MAG TPA: class I SAM-dependent methyltransferase [Acidimicrobiales bacterium]
MTSRVRRRVRQSIRIARTPRHLRPAMRQSGMVSIPEAVLLHDLARDVADGVIVEVGCYRGRSTVALSLGARSGRQARIFSLDPHETYTGVNGGNFGPADRGAFFSSMLRTGCYQNVRLINLSSEEVTPGWRHPVGLLWLDGDHSAAGVRRDLAVWRPHLLPGAVVAFDDSRDETSGPGTVIAEEVAAGRLQFLARTEGITTLRVIGPA